MLTVFYLGLLLGIADGSLPPTPRKLSITVVFLHHFIVSVYNNLLVIFTSALEYRMFFGNETNQLTNAKLTVLIALLPIYDMR